MSSLGSSKVGNLERRCVYGSMNWYRQDRRKVSDEHDSSADSVLAELKLFPSTCSSSSSCPTAGRSYAVGH